MGVSLLNANPHFFRDLDICADGLTGVGGDRDHGGQVPAEGMMDRLGDILSLSFRESLIGNIDQNPATFFGPLN